MLRRSVPKSVKTVSTTELGEVGKLSRPVLDVLRFLRGRVRLLSTGFSSEQTAVLAVSSKMGFRTKCRVEVFFARKLSRLKLLCSISCSNWAIMFAGISILSLSALEEVFVKYPRSTDAGRGEERRFRGRLREDAAGGGSVKDEFAGEYDRGLISDKLSLVLLLLRNFSMI